MIFVQHGRQAVRWSLRWLTEIFDDCLLSMWCFWWSPVGGFAKCITLAMPRRAALWCSVDKNETPSLLPALKELGDAFA